MEPFRPRPKTTRESPPVVSVWPRDDHSRHVSCLIEGAKDRLDALAGDIKGNAYVVRAKLSCELVAAMTRVNA